MKASQSSLYRELDAWAYHGARSMEVAMCVSCNSYMGFLVHHATYGLRRRMFGRMRWFWKMAYISGKYTKVVLKKKFINK